jgi:hypothetical protein
MGVTRWTLRKMSEFWLALPLYLAYTDFVAATYIG